MKPIHSLKSLCRVLAVSKDELNCMISNMEDHVSEFLKPKTTKRGHNLDAMRNLLKCDSILNRVLKRLNKYLISYVDFPSVYQGGIKGRSNISNAAIHKGKRFALSTDLKDCFPSISNDDIYKALKDLGFSPNIARAITLLTTRKGRLPQGFPTSSTLCNIVTMPMVIELQKLCIDKGILLSIYIDDITCSCPKPFLEYVPEILGVISSHGFKVNYKKTHYSTYHHLVTGIVVTQNRIGPASHIVQKQLHEKHIESSPISAYVKRISEYNSA
jgi:RNA-directed DNA polymerase